MKSLISKHMLIGLLTVMACSTAMALPPMLSCDVTQTSIPVTQPGQDSPAQVSKSSQVAQFVRNTQLDPSNDTAQMTLQFKDGSNAMLQATMAPGKEDMVFLTAGSLRVSGKNLSYASGSPFTGTEVQVNCEIYH